MSTDDRALRIAGVYTAIILGAGFASGQEIGSFFVRFGRAGVLGLLAAGLIFALVGWGTLEICRLGKVSDYGRFLELVMGERLASLMQAVVGLFLFVLYATMLSAGGAALHEALGAPPLCGVLALALLCFATFTRGIEGVTKINAMLAPVMVAGGIFVGLYTFCFRQEPVFALLSGSGGHWLLSAVTYASYNSVTAVTVLAAMGPMAVNPSVSFRGGALGAAAMTVLGICLFLPLHAVGSGALSYEIPLLAVVAGHHAVIRIFYMLVLLAAIYTTAAANGFALTEALRGKEGSAGGMALKALVTVGAVLASQLGFSTFVRHIYPLFGIFGFIQSVAILRASYKMNCPRD